MNMFCASASGAESVDGVDAIPTETEFEQRDTEKILSKRYLVNCPPTGVKVDVLARNRHISWLSERLQQTSSIHLDSSRPWLVYWPLHSLDLLQATNRVLTQPVVSKNKGPNSNNEQTGNTFGSMGEALFEWLFRCFTYVEDTPDRQDQRHPISDHSMGSSSASSSMGGFAGGWRQAPHLASCWAACAALIIICDEIPKLRPKLKDRLDRAALTKWIASLRTPDGGFRMFTRGEVDLRATYCAACIATVFDLDAMELFPIESLEYIGRCQSLDGGISCNIHGSEGHGGYVSCGFLALLAMHCLRENQKRRRADADNLRDVIKASARKTREILDSVTLAAPVAAASSSLSSSFIARHYNLDVRQFRRWCALRQDPCTGAFSGRVNKLVDSCYSWWVGGALSALAIVDAAEDVLSGFQSERGQVKGKDDEGFDSAYDEPLQQQLPASAVQVMKLRSLSLVQNALLLPEATTRKILKELSGLVLETKSGSDGKATSGGTGKNNDDCGGRGGGDDNDDDINNISAGPLVSAWDDESFDDGGDFAYNQDHLAEYVLELCQARTGGLCDKPDLASDLYHTCYSLSGLSVSVVNDQAKVIEELDKIYQHRRDQDGESNNSDPSTPSLVISKLIQEAYKFQQFEASESLKSTPFQATHPLLNLTRKRVKFALEFFGGRESLL